LKFLNGAKTLGLTNTWKTNYGSKNSNRPNKSFPNTKTTHIIAFQHDFQSHVYNNHVPDLILGIMIKLKCILIARVVEYSKVGLWSHDE